MTEGAQALASPDTAVEGSTNIALDTLASNGTTVGTATGTETAAETGANAISQVSRFSSTISKLMSNWKMILGVLVGVETAAGMIMKSFANANSAFAAPGSIDQTLQAALPAETQALSAATDRANAQTQMEEQTLTNAGQQVQAVAQEAGQFVSVLEKVMNVSTRG